MNLSDAIFKTIENQQPSVDEKASARYPVKIKSSLKEELTNLLNNSGIKLSFSKEWLAGNEVYCFVYLTGNQIAQDIAKLIEEKTSISKQDAPNDTIIAPLGKQTIKAKIVKVYSSSYQVSINKYAPVVKATMVLKNSSLIHGTIPSAILKSVNKPEKLIGKIIEFDATFELKEENNKAYSLFSRPSKASFIEAL